MVKRQIEALNRGDWGGSIEGVDPQIEWVVAREHPASRTLHGIQDLRAYRQDWAQSLGDLRFEPERVVGKDDVVVAIGRIKGTGAESGAEVGVPLGFLSRFRDGVVVRVEEYLDPQDALEAAGLGG